MMKYKKSAGSIAFDVCNYIAMGLLVFITVYPFWYVIVGSFNEGLDFNKGGIYFWPRKWSFANYAKVFSNEDLVNAFLITVSRTVLGVITHTLFTGLFAFGFYRHDLVFKKAYWVICIIPMFIGGGTIPYYLWLQQLKLTDTFWGYIIPWMFAFWDVLVLTSFFDGIPQSLCESARMDGISEFGLFFKIIFPLSLPVFAALALFNGVGQWNSFFDSLLYNSGVNHLKTLQHVVVLMLKSAQDSSIGNTPGGGHANTTSTSVQYASIVVTTLPILVLYPFLQKYFVYGVMTGAVKE